LSFTEAVAFLAALKNKNVSCDKKTAIKK